MLLVDDSHCLRVEGLSLFYEHVFANSNVLLESLFIEFPTAARALRQVELPHKLIIRVHLVVCLVAQCRSSCFLCDGSGHSLVIV